MTEGKVYSLYELGLELSQEDTFEQIWEPQYGDREYDYGYADDGWPRPGPCPVCGAPDWTCVVDYYAERARAEYLASLEQE